MAPGSRTRRIDVIRKILHEAGGRIRMKELVAELMKRDEDGYEVPYSAIYIAISAENDRLEAQGKARLFRTSRDGEARGWVSLASGARAGTSAAVIEQQILKANEGVDEELRKRLEAMEWRTFESTFLTQVLEKLGFQNVQITQATRDGGVDARVAYKRGVVEAKAIVSAKHWSASKVPVAEVRQMRGIKGDEDTAIIVTSGRFSEDAKTEASPGQNQRVVFLIDGDRLIEICKEFKIGVKESQLPPLLELDAEEFGATEDDDAEVDLAKPAREISDEMLGNATEGLSVQQLAKLTALSEGTIRTYLGIEVRRNSILTRLRDDERLHKKALDIVNSKRD